jgi:23S rRNA G2445 N2-methylase RlmL
VTAAPLRALLAAWTRGPIRWRLGFAKGHKRAIVWQVARDVTAAAPELLNDPTSTTWDILVDDEAGTLELVPKKLEDPRFAWRVAEVPAASHPTVAAALAWVAEARAGDRVWDPFCGAGAELVERARRGPVRSLHGSDTAPEALAAARQNADAAGVALELVQGDARTYAPGPVDLIITNPPLGSRVQLDAAALLVAALPNLARQLAPRGRLVWITPAHRKTTPVAEQLGLRLAVSIAVDLGGVRGQLERWER